MARARNIKPSIFKNELLGQADPLMTLLFISLWTLADKEGRLEDRPLRIKAETFPYRENININGYLTQLQQLGFIDRYSVGEIAIIQVITFKEHQSPHSTEKSSTLPAKPIDTQVTVNQPLNNESTNVVLNINVLNPSSLIPDSPILIPDTGIPSKSKTISASALLAALDIPENLASDWIVLRKSKKAAITQTALDGIQREADKAGMSLEAALRMCCERGWAGFKADWAKPPPTGVQDARLDVARQIMGDGHGIINTIYDINTRPAIENSRAGFPKAIAGIWESDAGEMAGYSDEGNLQRLG